jgi:hypothetical protein
MRIWLLKLSFSSWRKVAINLRFLFLVCSIKSILFYFGWIIFGLSCDVKFLVVVCCKSWSNGELLEWDCHFKIITLQYNEPWKIVKILFFPFLLCHLDKKKLRFWNKVFLGLKHGFLRSKTRFGGLQYHFLSFKISVFWGFEIKKFLVLKPMLCM